MDAIEKAIEESGWVRVSLSMEITVHDRKALRRAAWEKARDEDGFTLREWFKGRIGREIEADVQQLIDPGLSPDGLSIEDCTVEVY